MADDQLGEKQGRYLLTVARQTIANALGVSTTGAGCTPETHQPDEAAWVQKSGATFVTLHTRSGALRGCIGSLIAHRPLIEDVRSNALAAAFEDPRFRPLTAQELTGIVIEVSVLTAPEPLPYKGGEDLIRQLSPHVDGVTIEQGWHRATFLPQVWDQLPVPEEFLGHLCYKAGISASAWRNGHLEVSTYRVQEFEEPTP